MCHIVGHIVGHIRGTMKRKHDTRPVPSGAKRRVHEGKPQVQIRVGGKLAWCDLTPTGRASVTRPEWFGQLRMADGSKKTIKLFTDKAASEAYLHDQQRLQDRIRVGLEAPMDTTEQKFSDLVESYWQDKARRGVGRGSYGQKLNKILAGLAVNSIQDVKELTTEKITRFIDGMTRDISRTESKKKGTPVSNGTKQNHVICLGTFLRWLKEKRLIGFIPKLPTIGTKVEFPRRGITKAEMKKLVAVSPWPRSLFYELLFSTLTRRGAMCRVVATDCNFDDPKNPWLLLRGSESKTKTTQQVPIPPRLVPAIKRLIAETPAGVPLFHALKSNIINWHFDRDCANADIPKQNHEGLLVIHSLRHGGATELLKAGVSILLVQKMGGWKTLRMLQESYAHLSPVQTRMGIDAVFSDMAGT